MVVADGHVVTQSMELKHAWMNTERENDWFCHRWITVATLWAEVVHLLVTDTLAHHELVSLIDELVLYSPEVESFSRTHLRQSPTMPAASNAFLM